MFYGISWWARVEYEDRIERFYKHPMINFTTQAKPGIIEQALRAAGHLLKS
ncbi:MAG TPA: hypothetical protein VGK81_13805 [Anaerolineae bacterium]